MKQKNKEINRNLKSSKGITLVALVITIIILLILAGVTLNLTLGENGLLNRSESAKQKHEEEAAREKLELALGEIYSHKHTNTDYNENEFIDNKLNSQGMAVIPDTNIVIVDNWLFEIDRSVPKIVNGLGPNNENKNIQIIEKEQIISSDYVTATLKIQIIFDGELSSIYFNGKNVNVPTSDNGVYNIEDIVRDNGNYIIMVKDKEGRYKFETIRVTELTEDMEIWNKADMETFRNKVNSGRTFQGRKATLMDNINLEGSKTSQWIPIVNFRGTFEGNNKKIENLYIENTSNTLGLFASLSNAHINNVTIDNSTLIGVYYVGAIVGNSVDSIVSNCHVSENVTVRATGKNQYGSYAGGIAGLFNGNASEMIKCSNFSNVTSSYEFCGGIAGMLVGKVDSCYNAGTIKGATSVGGIMGANHKTTYVKNCYNMGAITGSESVGGIMGYSHNADVASLSIMNCYNIGKVNSAGQFKGGIIGNDSKNLREISNNYWISNCGPAYGRGGNRTDSGASKVTSMQGYATKLGQENWIDGSDGYPILKWQGK